MRDYTFLVRIPFFRIMEMDHYTTLILCCFLMTSIIQIALFSIKQYQLVKHNRMLRLLQEELDYVKRRKRQALLLLKQRRKAS